MAETSEIRKTGESIALVMEAITSSSTTVTNVGQGFITITEDKVEIVLRDYEAAVLARASWQFPLGILITTVTTLLTTATFQKFLGLSGDVWNAIFALCASGSFLWLLYSGVRCYQTRDHANRAEILRRMKEPRR